MGRFPKTDPFHLFNGSPVIEGRRVGTQGNYGPLGGFYLSLNGNYKLTKNFYIGAYVNNLLGAGNYEMVSTAPVKTTIGAELKYSMGKN